MPRTEKRKLPDEVCAEFAKKKVKITVRSLPDDIDVILIEGKPEALEFLGQLLLAHAASDDCGFQISPQGAGKRFFGPESTKGLYLHRVPCEGPSNSD